VSVHHRGEYPADWREIAKRVKTEANDRCIRCGHRNDATWWSNAMVSGGAGPCVDTCTHAPDGKQRVLTVHHLDGDKSNSRWWNLLPLCQVCHLQIQAKLDPDQVYLWEHSEWFKPFVAGYYAFAYAALELTRAEVERALEYWLMLGQPHRMENAV
jgi:5-methylcytosine-specific restriction endonuclease McrA